MNPTKLRHVLAVDEAQSISRAAETINITQSSVSKSVSEIEATLGYSLFIRHARGVRTTERGRDFIGRLHHIFSDLDRLVHDATHESALRNRVFRVGVTPLVTQGLMANPLRVVMERFPEVRVHVQAAPIERALQNLQRGEVDILYGPSELLKVNDDFIVTEAARFKIRLFVRRDHPLTQTKKITLKQLRQYPLIIADTIKPYFKELQIIADTSYQRPQDYAHIIEHFPVMLDLVARLDVVGFVEERIANSDSFKQHFNVLDIGTPTEVSFSCAYPSERQKSDLVQSFIEGAGENKVHLEYKRNLNF